MVLGCSDLVGVHSAVSLVEELLERRRATYQLGVQLATGADEAVDLPETVIDNPLVRGHLAEVFAGTRDLDARLLTSVDVLSTSHVCWNVAGSTIRVAATPTAVRDLVPAVGRIGNELLRSGADTINDAVLIEGSAGFEESARVLREGIDLALDIAYDLAADLLPHIALFALLDRDRAGRLGSASAREYPG